MTKTMTKTQPGFTVARVSLCLWDDGRDAVLAQVDPRERWNGWLCPALDALGVQTTLEALVAANGEHNAAEGVSWAWLADGALLVTEHSYPDEPYVLDPDQDGLYHLGAYSWTWTWVDRQEPWEGQRKGNLAEVRPGVWAPARLVPEAGPYRDPATGEPVPGT